ncbi:MAG: dTMP kinase [Planctomycetes bacterium]|nr:dTMP kinase [Planctomycetota bacterium]
MAFLTFDGIDGVGKSTQIERLQSWIEAKGRETVRCRDPGSTELGERLRHLLLDPDSPPIGRRAETLIYMASRAQLVDDVIRPALARGAVVLSDRFLLANIAYQGYAGGLDPELVRSIGHLATDGVMPDLVFLLDAPVETALSRRRRTADRMEARGVEYLERVRRGFLREAERDPQRIAVIDAGLDPDTVQEAIRRVADDRAVFR